MKDNEGKRYNIEYSYDENNIYFETFFTGDVLTEKYFLALNLNTLKKSCKSFNLLENLLESFNFIKDLIKMNKVSIKNENNSLNLIMNVPVLLKEEEIKFSLNKQINSQQDLIKDLIQRVKELKNENQKLKQKYWN